MKILLLGKNGQVGWELQRALAPVGTVVALDRGGADGLHGDLEDLDGIDRTVRSLAPDVIVNAAAYTAVDKAETDVERAQRINAEAPGVLARAAATVGALLVHYSTDYVFDGSGDTPWRENAPTAPLSVYGRSKLAGEEAIRAAGCRHLILRTSWVYAARGGNFARTMLRLAAERERLTVIADQHGAPTGAELIADVSAHALRAEHADRSLGGTYHLAAGGETSWHGYASFVIEQARKLGATLKAGEIAPIGTRDYPTAAARPLNSRLDTSRLRERFGLALPDWRDGVARMLREILD
ncbi:MAG TPA: dTDP-4-dehydrorhamnose reductase [Thauera aminoaromatica]|uniref:dTDP-4-dehydrorhamnose reductase n=1 Tax=Thauera aminoaromatica TaxID=164330 RepID=C4ZPN2_THASP|nr:dTDP-4-dehydrorhamnose reductase [Thauera aminoaromatica]ACK54878.1 dTDP-4-dehydrorhamnose reductase [Thauera aminoaromatica]HMU16560.1 dTDP-4-dehydrorhamnose reductase [Thauera aminoaromatica]HMY78283.1 dTDP-4-dehydrorhamnose reductase [Thauera aminoaromatica]HMZ30479.1 dTDP-4-dehydrorhamnose reductase [Thauera aminoaromatica]HNB05574.1 dTDP-4-dehydrorhamnose reductase [Thauera aminoaromatica]